MNYFVSGCRYCNGDQACHCNCHFATQEDIEEGFGHCDKEVYD